MDPEKWTKARKREIEKIPPWEDLIRGTLVCYRLTCGNKGCRCHRAQKWRHGPYWYVTVTYPGGHQKRYLIPAGLVPRVRSGIEAYRRLWKGLCRISEINLALLKEK